MKDDWQQRTRLLVGEERLECLRNSHVLVVGVGGVGGYAAELMVRAGVGEMTIVDADTVSVSNVNRQIIALHSTVGRAKVEVLGERLVDINPDLRLHVIQDFMHDDKIVELMQKPYTAVLDAIDTLTPKTMLLYHAVQNGQNVVSCMGSGGKYHPEKICIDDISKSHDCRLAFNLRKRLHRLGIRKGIKVVYSPEEVDKSVVVEDKSEMNKASTVGTIAYVPAAFGCFCASVVVNGIIGEAK